MGKFYSAEKGGFYTREIHGDTVPADAVEITESEHGALLAGQAAGLRIVADEDGRPRLVSPPPPTLEQIQRQCVDAVQAHMDDAARALNYDDIKTAVTYADEPAVPKFQAEGQAFRAWRSLVWATCYQIMDEVLAEQRPVPTAAELIAQLPLLTLPSE